jgi:hypothetical protein
MKVMCHTASAKFSFFFLITYLNVNTIRNARSTRPLSATSLFKQEKGKRAPFYVREAYRGSTRWRWSLTSSSSFTLKRKPGTHCTGGYVIPRAGLVISENKSLAPAGIRSPDGTGRSPVAMHSNFTYCIAKIQSSKKVQQILARRFNSRGYRI